MTIALFYPENHFLHDSNRIAKNNLYNNYWQTLQPHPENPDRLTRVLTDLQQTGYLDKVKILHLPSLCSIYDILRVHSTDLLQKIYQLSSQHGGWITAGTYVSPGSFDTIQCSAAGIGGLISEILCERADNAFALIRPPGHHATTRESMGFCLVNNVAIGATCALQNSDIKRILIVDWDLHHGNGTQEIFEARRDVMYFSVHAQNTYSNDPDRKGDWKEMGVGDGIGYSMNIPLPAGCKDIHYITVFHKLLIPLAETYQPNLIIISAGFDAHSDDPFSCMQITTFGYREMLRVCRYIAKRYCQNRLLLILEGGYNLNALSASVQACFDVLLDTSTIKLTPLTAHFEDNISIEVNGLINSLRGNHPIFR